MATTAVEICNLALDNLGVTNKIATLNAAGTKEERACARWYAMMRDAALRDYPWPFAARSAELVAIDEAVETHPQWGYLYSTPADWLKSRRVFVEGQIRNVQPPIPFATFLNDAKTAYIVGADVDLLWLEYTIKFDTDALVALMPEAFADALSWKLATRLVKPLSLDSGLIKEAEEMYRKTAGEAFGENIAEVQFDQQPDPDYIAQR